MKPIMNTVYIEYNDEKEFHDEIVRVTNEQQALGRHVDIQFTVSPQFHTNSQGITEQKTRKHALILSRGDK